MSQANVALFEADSASFRERFKTQDECWVHHFKLETKRQSMHWKHPSSPPPCQGGVIGREGEGLSLLG